MTGAVLVPIDVPMTGTALDMRSHPGNLDTTHRR
jgi:hypothetical protein